MYVERTEEPACFTISTAEMRSMYTERADSAMRVRHELERDFVPASEREGERLRGCLRHLQEEAELCLWLSQHLPDGGDETLTEAEMRNLKARTAPFTVAECRPMRDSEAPGKEFADRVPTPPWYARRV
jgi:hypothetical protein